MATRKNGEFCWINMLTSAPEASKAFFADLLGWTFIELPGMGFGIKVNGHDVGGLFDLAHPNTPPGLAPVIGVMVKVESVDATAEKVVALGGKAKPGFDIGEAGRMAVLHDPVGAQFDIWEPKKMPGTDVEKRTHGAPTWFETLSTDAAKVEPFYKELFGWTAETAHNPKYSYTTCSLDGIPVAGIMQITPDMGPIPSHWGVYFAVTDSRAIQARVGELGGTVFIPVQEIPGIGRFVGILSPQQVRFYVVEYD